MSTTSDANKPRFRLKLLCDTMCAFVSSYGSSLGMPIKGSFDAYRAAVMDASDFIQDLNSLLTISLVSDIDDGRALFKTVLNPSDSPSSSLSCESKLCPRIAPGLTKFLPANPTNAGSGTLRDLLSDTINLSCVAARMPTHGVIFEIGVATRPPLVTISMDPEAFWDACFAVCGDLDPSEMVYADRAYVSTAVVYFHRLHALQSPPFSFKRQCPFCWKTTDLQMPETIFRQWRHAGMNIEDVLPSATSDEREMYMTGICPGCWPTGDEHDGDDGGDSDGGIDISSMSFSEPK